jgi:hypothetical protein
LDLMDGLEVSAARGVRPHCRMSWAGLSVIDAGH